MLLKDSPDGTLRLRKLLMQWLDKNLALLTSGEEGMPLRVFATTDVELPRLIEAGLVAPELLQKLGVLRLSVPPLRERSADIPRLCEHFLSELSIESGAPIRTLAPRALDQVMRYSWPGNLAELRDVMRRTRAREPAIQLGGRRDGAAAAASARAHRRAIPGRDRAHQAARPAAAPGRLSHYRSVRRSAGPRRASAAGRSAAAHRG